MNKFLITGTGRCGTKYCQAVLRVCGINCGHQSVFKHENTLSGGWDWLDYDGDSSFEAVPLLPKIKETGVFVIHLVRDPDKVIKSWLKLGLFQDNMRRDYEMLSAVLDEYFPEVLKARDPEARATLFVDKWRAYTASFADATFDIENDDPARLFEILGIMNKYDKVLVDGIRKDVNTYAQMR